MTLFESAAPVKLPAYLFESVTPERYALVDRFYRAQGYKVKCATQEKVFVLGLTTGEIIAAVRLVPQRSGHYWLRNLLVAPEWRNLGLASALLNRVKPAIAPYGCYFFALPHLLELYQRLEFERNPLHCPEDIAAIYDKYRSRGRDWVLMGYIQQ